MRCSLGVALAALVAAACSDSTSPRERVAIVAPRDTLQVGEQVQLSALGADPERSSTVSAAWSSSDTTVVTVSAAGLATARFPGTALLVARAGAAADSILLLVSPVDFETSGLGAVRERFTAEVSVRGDYAYTTTWGARSTTTGVAYGNAIKVWDVRGGAPVLLDSVIVTDDLPAVSARPIALGADGSGHGEGEAEEAVSTLGDVQVSDDGKLLVVATELSPGSILIFSLDDPAHPRLVGRHRTASTAPGVHTAEVARVNGTLYAFLSVDPPKGGAAPGPQLVVVDLSTPGAPVEVLARPMGDPIMHDVFVRDGTLFTAEWDRGVRIWDVGGTRGGSPSNPVELGRVTIPGGAAHNVWWVHDSTTGSKRWLAIGQELDGGSAPTAGDVFLADVSVPGAAKVRAFYRLAGAGTHNFSVDERSGVLYAAYYNGGVRALDVRGDLAACPDAARRASDGLCDLAKMGREVGRFTTSQPVFVWGVQKVGGAVYASDMTNGLWKVDVARLRRD